LKLTLNCDWGSWRVPEPLEEKFNDVYNTDLRFNEEIIEWVENHKDETTLEVFDIPENTTDWYIDNYDGFETCFYVVDGTIYFLGKRIRDKKKSWENVVYVEGSVF